MNAYTAFCQDLKNDSDLIIKTGPGVENVSGNRTRLMKMDNYHDNMNIENFLEN